MKIILDTDTLTDNVTAVVASSENANFPATNLQDDFTTNLFKATGTSVKLTFSVSKGQAIEILNTNATSATVTVGTGGDYELESGWSLESGYSLEDDESATVVYSLPGSNGRLWADYTYRSTPHIVTVALSGSSVITAGIARAGVVQSFNNPKRKNKEGSDDLSIERELNNGAFYYRKRNVVREFSALQILESRANAWIFKHSIFDAVGPEPLAIKLIDNSNITDDEFVLFAKRTSVELEHINNERTLIHFGLKETV